MPTIQALRKRLPLVVFLLLLVLILLMVGVACACLGSQPVQALERSLGAPALGPPLVELWALLTVLLFPSLLMAARRPAASGRASPAALQRFLF